MTLEPLTMKIEVSWTPLYYHYFFFFPSKRKYPLSVVVIFLDYSHFNPVPSNYLSLPYFTFITSFLPLKFWHLVSTFWPWLSFMVSDKDSYSIPPLHRPNINTLVHLCYDLNVCSPHNLYVEWLYLK